MIFTFDLLWVAIIPIVRAAQSITAIISLFNLEDDVDDHTKHSGDDKEAVGWAEALCTRLLGKQGELSGAAQQLKEVTVDLEISFRLKLLLPRKALCWLSCQLKLLEPYMRKTLLPLAKKVDTGELVWEDTGVIRSKLEGFLGGCTHDNLKVLGQCTLKSAEVLEQGLHNLAVEMGVITVDDELTLLGAHDALVVAFQQIISMVGALLESGVCDGANLQKLLKAIPGMNHNNLNKYFAVVETVHTMLQAAAPSMGTITLHNICRIAESIDRVSLCQLASQALKSTGHPVAQLAASTLEGDTQSVKQLLHKSLIYVQQQTGSTSALGEAVQAAIVQTEQCESVEDVVVSIKSALEQCGEQGEDGSKMLRAIAACLSKASAVDRPRWELLVFSEALSAIRDLPSLAQGLHIAMDSAESDHGTTILEILQSIKEHDVANTLLGITRAFIKSDEFAWKQIMGIDGFAMAIEMLENMVSVCMR